MLDLKQAEQTQAANEENALDFYHILETLPAAVYATDAQGLITYFNRQAAVVWGREPKQQDPRDRYSGAFRLFTPDGRLVHHDQNWMARCLQERREFKGEELVIERPDGSRCFVRATATPFFDASGRLTGASSVMTELTGTNQAEHAMSQLAAIVESSEDAIIGKNADGFITSWNRGAERLYGYTPEEVMGKPISILHPPEHPDEFPEIMRLLLMGERIDHLETVRLRKDGGRVDVSLTISPIMDAEGKIVGASKIARDITARKRAEEALRRQTDRIRLLWDAADVLLTAADPVAMLRGLFARIGPHLDADVYFNYVVNEAGDALQLASCDGIPVDTISQIRRLEFGQSICGMAALQREPIVVDHIQQSDDPKALLIKSFGIRAYACHPLLADGALLGTLSFGSRLKDKFESEEIEFLRTITRYVTVAFERVRLIQRLQEADRRKDEFLAMLAHELRNPLAPIRTAVRIAQEEAENATLARNHAIIERQAGNMGRLLDDLLDVSRITRGIVRLNRERLDLGELVRATLDACRPLIEEQEHELSFSLPFEPLYVDGDRVRLEQVVVNLLTNAAKYTEPGGKIEVTLLPQGTHAILGVRDTGKGIEPELLPHVFELFRQGERALDRSQGGLGIGLTLVKNLVELHGGRITARSEGAGRGSEFTVRLPLATGTGALEELETAFDRAASPTRAPAREGRVLVVDDNRDGANSLAEILSLWGFDARAVHDGPTALEEIQANGADVVLLDIGMPGMDGYQVARSIRESQHGKEPVLVAMTGYGRDEDREEARDAGFDHHLTKPVDLDQVQELLQRVLGGE